MLPVPSHKMLQGSPRRSAALSPLQDRRNAAGVAKHCGTTALRLAVRAAWTKPCPASCPGNSRRRSVCCPWRRRDWRGSCRKRSGGSGGRRGGPSRSASTSSASLACSLRPWSPSGTEGKLLRRCQTPPPCPREPPWPSLFLLRRRRGQHCTPSPAGQ